MYSFSTLALVASSGQPPFEVEDADDAAFDGAASDSSSSGSCRKRPRLARPFSTDDTLLLVDWDDTVLPLHWIQQEGLQLARCSTISERQLLELAGIAASAARMLQAAKRLGHVVIVTNAERGWVELSCARFLPSLFPVLEGTKVVSARSSFERRGPSGEGSPTEWKQAAFELEMRRCRGSECGRWINVLSLGDSNHEREALLSATAGAPDCCAKSVKLLQAPSPWLLRGEHDLVRRRLREIVESFGDLDLHVREVGE